VYNHRVPAPSPPSRRPPRSEPREIAELRLVKANQPELADAVDLQIELLLLHRRVQARVPLPWFDFEPAWLAARQEQGRPVLLFERIPLEWTDVRLMFRQTADILWRFHAIEPDDQEHLQVVARTGNLLEPLVARWYEAAGSADARAVPLVPLPAPVTADALDQVLVLAMRPFLERCAESIQQVCELKSWKEPRCPVCGGEVEFASITPGADRLLICGRCAARWRFDPIACPFCRNADRTRITSFTSRDGRYRLYACDVCRRYLKAHDGRQVGRPLMLAVDTIATLPLDAAAIKKGYRS
jgi:hypothetical protein